MEIAIRDARNEDAALIAEFNSRLAKETENVELPPARIRAGVDAVLDDPSKGRYWVAEADGVVAGQIMVTYEWSDWRNGMLWWIQSVYVHEDYRRAGVFTALYRHVEAMALERRDVRGLRLYVEHSNERARSTYAALGMAESGYLVMQSIPPTD